jgi:hypothetical protein
MCWAEACAVGGALRAREPFAFRTVVTTGASALRIQMPATASPCGGHCSHRRRRAVTVRHSCATRCSGPGRSGGAGQGRICRHSWPIGWPGWRNEMDCLHSLQTGAIKASLRQVGWTVTTPSVTAAPDGPREQRQGTPAACAATRSTEAGRGTTGYYMERPARAESSPLRGLSPGREDGTVSALRASPSGQENWWCLLRGRPVPQSTSRLPIATELVVSPLPKSAQAR